MNSDIQLSELDEQRFGIRSARVKNVTLEILPEILEFADHHKVVFMIARCPVNRLDTVQAMEKAGFRLMDTLVYWMLDTRKKPIPEDTGLDRIRIMLPDDIDSVERVAAEAFHDYYGHYHADPRLDKRKCDEVYIDWAVRSVHDRSMADEVLVAEVDGHVIGFVTLRQLNAVEGEIIHGGVIPSAQGKGIYRSFITSGVHWIHNRGMSLISLSTQITNTAVQRVWARLGFEYNNGYYTFHKWFDEV